MAIWSKTNSNLGRCRTECPCGAPQLANIAKKILSEANTYINGLSQDQQKEKRSQYKSIESIDNPWIIFDKLESILGPNGFEAAIKRNLSLALKCQVPNVYTELWKLGISGFLTLNIDRLASRGFHEANIGENLVERSGFDVRALIGNITTVGSGRFIANLHGVFEDPQTWVFTETRRKALFSDQRYTEFVRDTLKYCTVVMLGVSAHDIAIREHLAKLKSDGLGNHSYWISSEIGNEALKLAEESGIRFIHYKNTDGRHGELSNFLQDVKTLAKAPPKAPPVVSTKAGSAETINLPPLNELLTLTPNEQRQTLNSFASQILIGDNERSYAEFEDFCKTYNRAIHAAGLFELEDGSDKVLDFTLCNLEDSEGGFGTIWRAVDKDGNQVAVKVFKHDIRKNQNLLQAFRRGVRSLRILDKHALPHIVKFITACEIPPVLVMEWIEGVNLHTAVTQGKFRSWETRIRVACDLAKAIYSAHSVPERVLHRDIKPQNIMFKDFYPEGENSELVVLDFDLSWHVGALEKSVLAKGSNPYLAPEQLISISEMTSRSAAVDAFGLGMTLYFLCSGQVPTPFMHQTKDWENRLKSIASQQCKIWHSTPKKIARLIALCTKHDQNQRPSFSQITADLEKINHILNGIYDKIDIGLFCEELASRTEALSGYEISADGSILWTSTTQRLKTSIHPKNSSEFSIKFEFIQTGNEQFNSLANASELISKSHLLFPSEMLNSRPLFSQQHGNYINELQLEFNSHEPIAQLEKLQKAMHLTMDKLMAAGS